MMTANPPWKARRVEEGSCSEGSSQGDDALGCGEGTKLAFEEDFIVSSFSDEAEIEELPST